MKKRLVLLGALSAFFAAPAYGFNVASVMLNSTVLDTVKQTGTTVVMDGPVCKDDGPYGAYQIGPKIDMLTICSRPHATSPDELKDTIRHEAWHIVQVCNGGPIYEVETLDGYLTDQEIQFVKGPAYPPEQYHEELEARVIAQEEDETFVVNALKNYCFE